MSLKVRIRHVRLPGMAECEQCEQLPPGATRTRARMHAINTGHTVRYMVEEATIYTPAEGGRR